MIRTEFYRIREDGVELVITYSDNNKMIECDGIQYSEAVDPKELGRIYTETDIPIENDDTYYAEAGKILMGVSE